MSAPRKSSSQTTHPPRSYRTEWTGRRRTTATPGVSREDIPKVGGPPKEYKTGVPTRSSPTSVPTQPTSTRGLECVEVKTVKDGNQFRSVSRLWRFPSPASGVLSMSFQWTFPSYSSEKFYLNPSADGVVHN